MKPFIFGFGPSVEDSALLDTTSAFHRVGDNTGNLAFCYAISSLLGGGLRSALWHADPTHLKRLGDIGVLTLANQLGNHVDLGYLNSGFKKIDFGLVGIGLGAQASLNKEIAEVPQGTLEWVRLIQERSPTSAANIGVRGAYSLNVLEHYGLADKALVTGCPTLFINPDKNLGSKIWRNFSPKLKRIAVAAGHQRWHHLAKLEASLVALSQQGWGSYICQSPLEMVQLGRGEAAKLNQSAITECRSYVAPSMSEDEFILWANRSAQSFFSASAWMEHLLKFDFVVGTRIHGVMLALQVGVPALCLAHDSRTVELCETMGVPYAKAQEHAHGITRDQLPTLFKFDPDLFDSNRIKLARNLHEFLTSNKLSPAAYLNDLIS